MSYNYPVVFSVSSGKGGVGKTNISVNLACSLSRMGYNTVLLDADLGLGNVDVLLGLAPKYNLFHLFFKQVELDKILLETRYDFRILPAASGVSEMLTLSSGQKLELLEAMDVLEDEVDFFLVDTGAGINENVLYFNMAVQNRIIVVTPEPTSLTDAYALIKVLHVQHGVDHFKVLVNFARDSKEAKQVFSKLYAACDYFLNEVSLDWLGFIPQDDAVPSAVIQQVPFCESAPDSLAAKNISSITENIVSWNGDEQLDGNIKFFWKKLLFRGEYSG
ncbi:MAG: MinD/ParA family protein [Thermodesulfobacteriota bacterium]